MNDSIKRLAELEQHGAPLLSSIARMNAIGVYFSIEIARSSTASRVFASYGSDIRTLFAEIVESVVKIHKETAENYSNQLAVFQSLDKNYTAITKDSQDAIRESYTAITRISRICVETLERITDYFAALTRQISRIITAIQVGDITRQQIEHIIGALTDVEARSAREAWENGSVEQDRQIEKELFQVAALQLAQLQHVRAEITECHATLQKALDQIGVIFDVLVADVQELLSGERTSTGRPSWDSELTGELKKMWELEKSGMAIAERTVSTMDQVFRASTLLRRYIESIGKNNRRLALEAYNARILSMRLGQEGRTLTTLAKEVSGLSQTMHDYVGKVTGAIAAIVALADEAASRIKSAARPATDGAATGGQDSGRADLDRLHDETNAFIRLTSGACHKAGNLKADLHKINDGLKTMDAVGQQLDENLGILGSVVTSLSAAAGGTSEGEWTNGLHNAERYTMEAERLIHRQLAAGNDATDVSAPNAGGSSLISPMPQMDDDDDLGDNVDLF